MKKWLYSIGNGKKKTIIVLCCVLLTMGAIIKVNSMFVDDKRTLVEKSTEITTTETGIEEKAELAQEEKAVLAQEEKATIAQEEKATIAQEVTEAALTVDRAKEIALNKTGGGTVVKCESDYEDGRLVYDIKVINGNYVYDMDIDAASAAIYEYEEKMVMTETVGQQAGSGSQISAERAKEIALEKAGEGTVVSCNLDYEDGIYVYEIEIIGAATEYDIEVKAEDGSIVKFKQDRFGN